MKGAATVQAGADGTDRLFDRVGAFLAANRLSPEPAHYAFAYRVVSQPDSLLARTVAGLMDGGIRLSRQDIERLGGSVVVNARAPATDGPSAEERMVARASSQVESFATMVRSMHDETRCFSRDLAARAAALAGADEIDDFARIAAAMIERIRESETRLAQADRQAETLRAELREARDTARRDPLTALPNRRAFEEAFGDRPAASHCLAICDIDRFKQVNDAFGHAVGDRVLTAIARTLAERCGDALVARHGGEEFAILFSGVTVADAAALLEDARIAIGARRFRTRETDEPLGAITVSAGVTAIHPGEDCAAAFARADRLLYAAKAGGRNRTRYDASA